MNDNKSNPFIVVLKIVGGIVLALVFIGGCMQDFRLTNW